MLVDSHEKVSEWSRFIFWRTANVWWFKCARVITYILNLNIMFIVMPWIQQHTNSLKQILFHFMPHDQPWGLFRFLIRPPTLEQITLVVSKSWHRCISFYFFFKCFKSHFDEKLNILAPPKPIFRCSLFRYSTHKFFLSHDGDTVCLTEAVHPAPILTTISS